MTLPELKTLFMSAAINSIAAMFLSLRWGKAEWTAYFWTFAGWSATFGYMASIVEKKIIERAEPDVAKKMLATDLFPDTATI